jgi:hypothetical protein
MKLPHEFKRIRLNLARSKEYPMGSSRHGYELVAPLNAEGHIDPQLWQRYRQYCHVRRFWAATASALVGCSIGPVAPNTLAGFSIMTSTGPMTMRRDIALGHTPLSQESTYQSATATAICIHLT